MNKRFAKIISLMLVLVMVLGVVPGSVFAGPQYNDGTNGFGDLIRNWWEIIVRPLPWYKPTPNYPAQSFGGDDLGGLVVNVEAPAGALPEGTEMYVERVYNTTNIQTAVDNSDLVNGDVIAAVDITFYHNGAEFQPGSDVKVTLSYAGFDGCDDLSVVHIGASAEEVVNEVPFVDPVEDVESDGETVSFDARDFSVYAVIGDATGDNKLLTVEFYSTDGTTDTIINTQVIRMSQIAKLDAPVFDPGVPSINTTQSFEGWSRYQNYASLENDRSYSVDQINSYIKRTYNADSDSATLKFYAKVYNVRYIVYHDQAGAVLMTQAYHVATSTSTENVKIEYSYVGFMGGQNFAGWIIEDYVDVAGDYPLYKDTLNPAEVSVGGNVYKNGTTYQLSDTLQLYPYLNTGNWLVFDTYKDQDTDDTSTSYVSPVFYADGEDTVAPATPTRTGYQFDGWYREKSFTNRFIFGSPINEETTIYAKWTRNQTTYQVVFWQQNVTDSVDATDANKTYAFYKSDVRTALTGSSVALNISESGTTADNRLGGNSTTSIGEMGFYFSYNAVNSDTTSAVVKGDGSTVLNVYYDRKVITYNFYGDLTDGYSSFNGNYYSSYYPHYGYSSASGVFRIYTNASTYSDGDYYNTPTWYTNAACTNKYSGTVYHLTFDTETLSNNSADFQYGSIQGLYGSTMDYYDWSSASTTISGNEWPYSGSYLMWHDATTGRYQNKMFQYTTGEATTSTTIDYYLNQYEVSSTTRPYTCLGQDVTGSFTIELDEGSLKSTETLYFSGDEYYGYVLDRYNRTSNNYNSAIVWGGGQVSCSYDNIGSGGHAYFYYARNKWNFEFESNNSTVKTESIYWESSLSDLASYVPTNGPEGCYFDGWYADPGLGTEFNFSQEMPNNSVRVYAKWTMLRFRVVCDPTGGETGVQPSDITFPGNQATTFRVDYGEVVQGSSLDNAERAGYTLLGWFLDPEFTIPFNFGHPITDEIADMSYADAEDSERQGDDPWNINPDTENPVHYTDVGRENVRGKVTIYAKWRQNPDGIIGINVHYNATDKNGNTGKFSDNTTEWNDPNIYADGAMAFGQPASTPDNEALQFLYWEILDKDNNVVGKAYPGQLWEIDVDYAKITDLNAQAVYYTFDSIPKKAGSPTKAETITAYAPSDTIETGVDYLIGVKASNGTTYLLMSYNPSTGTYYGSASVSGYTSNMVCYAIPAIVDENGYVTGVDASGISGATLAHVEWIFNSTSNGKYSIQSGYNSSYYLRVGDDDSTTNLNLYPASYSSGYGATWVWDSSTHRLSHYYSSSYYRLYLAMLTNSSGVPTYFDVDSDSTYAKTVTLYKKTTIEVGPTMYTVTFMDGYTNTKIADVPVEEGSAAAAPDAPDHSAQGMIFNGWDTPFDNVTENITVTAQYVNQSTLSYTVTFRYMNSAGEWVSESQTVQHGNAATPPTVPTPPSGYTFNSWDKKFTSVTSSMTVNAVYKQVATRKFTIDLRAVYGRANTTAKTHIYWYANNDETLATGGDLQKNEDLAINQAITIPTPTSFSYTTGRETETGLVWEDHIFLGWARIDNETGANIAGDAHPELNEDDIFLAWDPTSRDYIVKKKIDGIDDVAVGQHVSKVAADEAHPYHDMYAVWATVFYVYHSGTNQVEKIVRTTKDGKTYDLAHTTSNGYLYGGYYTEYKGMSTGFDPKATGFFQDVNVSWNSGALVRDASWNQSVKDAGTGAMAYNGSNAQWDGNEAYKAEDPEGNGLEMKPEAGKTYFIKEVPASMYLQPYLHYTYYKDSANGFPVANAWLISDVDDLCYQETGFIITHESADGVHSARVAAQITIRPANGGNAVLLTPAKIFKAQGVEAGWLSYLAVINNNANQPSGWSNLLHDNDAVLRYWVTPDGLLVTGTVQSVYTGLAKVTTIGKTDTPVTSTIGEYTPNTL